MNKPSDILKAVLETAPNGYIAERNRTLDEIGWKGNKNLEKINYLMEFFETTLSGAEISTWLSMARMTNLEIIEFNKKTNQAV